MKVSGLKDWRTTLAGIIAGVSLFIGLNDDMFPPTSLASRIATFITGPGAVIFWGIISPSTAKVKEKTEERLAEVVPERVGDTATKQ